MNVHLIAKDPVTLVDTGPLTNEAWDALGAGMARHGLHPRDVRRVLLTHGHQDHYGQAVRIASLSGAALFGGRLDREQFRGRRSAKMLLDHLARHGFGIGTRLAVVASVAAVDGYATPLATWDELSGGETLSGDGYSVVARSVPGHTPGSLTFEVPEAGLLFTGDTVLKDITPNAIVDEDPERPGEVFRSVSRYFQSLDEMEETTPGETVLMTGHGRRIDDFPAHRRSLARRYQRRVDGMARVLADGPKNVRDLVEKLFPRLEPINVFLGYSEVLGFLMYLEDEGRVERLRGGLHDRYRLIG